MRPPSASHAAVEKTRRLRFPEGAAHAAHANPPPQLRSAWGAYTNQRVRPSTRNESSLAMNTPMPLPSTPMAPLSAHETDESPPNATKAAIAVVGQSAQIMKLASMQDKLSNVIANTQSALNQTYTEADMSIASLWHAVCEMRTDLDTLIQALKKDTSPVMAKKRRACIKRPHACSFCSNPPRSRVPHCDRIGCIFFDFPGLFFDFCGLFLDFSDLFVDFAVRGGARLGLDRRRERCFMPRVTPELPVYHCERV